MKFEILVNSIFRMPMEKALERIAEHKDANGFDNFAEQQRVFDILAHKRNAKDCIKFETIQKAALYFRLLTRGRNAWSCAAFECLKAFPNIVWIEMIGFLTPDEIMTILNLFHGDLTPVLIETFIINLPVSLQERAIELYRNRIGMDEELFDNFYFSVGEIGRSKLEELFPKRVPNTVLLKLKDLDEEGILLALESERESILKLDADEVLKFILLETQSLEILYKFMNIYKSKIDDCSLQLFKLFVTRYRQVRVRAREAGLFDDYEEETEAYVLEDMDLIRLFKQKFHELGLEETLMIFGEKEGYSYNAFVADIVMEFLDLAVEGVRIEDYVNDKTKEKIIARVASECREEYYSLGDFEKLVKKLGGSVSKLVYDDYIEATVACGKLLAAHEINDRHPLFLELREKFSKDLLSRCERDGTCSEDISLKGVFYRLTKGTLPFEVVYMIKTYRGLMYITKCGMNVEDADYVSKYLTDVQLLRLNIGPVLKWRETVTRKNGATGKAFITRMGMQLLCYFGIERARYLLESDMQDNTMENLFDGLDYKVIAIDDAGKPLFDERLGNYLFGRNLLRDSGSVINRVIRGSEPSFQKYFGEFCNNFDSIMEKCNGILSIKRIVRLFDNFDLPVELKPDEVEFEMALREMGTTNADILRDAISLCRDARERVSSTIPQVAGTLGDFTYKMLDLRDPLAVAIGHLSHCCFVVQGDSDSALRHAMQSVNGRVFVVYYRGRFLAQSWVWRNGDVVCFDSVEAGSAYHEKYDDEFNLLSVYKKAARQILDISSAKENEIQRVKVVTVGRSDFKFNGLTNMEITPRPLEKNLYVYDSNSQRILAGQQPRSPRFGPVGVQYFEPRKRPIVVDIGPGVDIDAVDEVMINVNALRYRIYKEEIPANFADYKKIVSGDGWYILLQNNGEVESGILKSGEDAVTEYNNHLKTFSKAGDKSEELGFVKKFTPLVGLNLKGE